MPGEFQVSVFSVSGRVDMLPRRPADAQTQDEKEKKPLELERSAASELNKRSQEIATSIESEMRRMLPPHTGTTVQAEVTFRSGSLLLEGSVILLSWAGTLALEAARTEIGEVIRIAFRRAIANALNALSTADIGAMEMTVAETRRPPVSQSSTRPFGALRSDAVPAWIPVLVLLLTALVLLLIADRFFVISTRTQISTPPTSQQTAPPSATAPRGSP